MSKLPWPKIIALIGMQTSLPALLFLGLEDGPEWLVFAFLGAIAGQVTLLAAFAALAPWRNGMLRLPVTLFLLTLLWFIFVLWLRVSEAWFLPQIAMVLAAMALWGFAVAFAFLRLGSWLSRWQLALASAPATGEVLSGQFRIIHILIATTGTAMLLALGRVVLPEGDWSPLPFESDVLGALGMMGACVAVSTLLFTPAALWGSSLQGRELGAFMLVWPLYIVLATLAENVLLLLLADAGTDSVFGPLVSFNLGHGIWLLASLVMLRWAGWTLTRAAKRSKLDPCEHESEMAC